MAVFVPGIELARRLYHDVVGPLVSEVSVRGRAARARLRGAGLRHHPIRHHDRGPRLQVFLNLSDAGRARQLAARLERGLPAAIAGHPTAITWDDGHRGHGVEITELGGWLTGQLGADPRTGFGAADWLATPTQALAEVTGGAVVHDPAGELAAVRTADHDPVLTTDPTRVRAVAAAAQEPGRMR